MQRHVLLFFGKPRVSDRWNQVVVSFFKEWGVGTQVFYQNVVVCRLQNRPNPSNGTVGKSMPHIAVASTDATWCTIKYACMYIVYVQKAPAQTCLRINRGKSN